MDKVVVKIDEAKSHAVIVAAIAAVVEQSLSVEEAAKMVRDEYWDIISVHRVADDEGADGE